MESNGVQHSIIRKIEKSLKLQIITCVLLSFLVIGVFFIVYRVIPVKYKYTISTDINLINQIEDINIKDNEITINGYAFLLNMDSDFTKISILLRNIDNGKEVWADVEQAIRKDVNSYFNNNNNYENSGFYASVREKKLKSNGCYEIFVKLSYNKIIKKPSGDIEEEVSKTVSTNKFILNNKLYSYNPYEFEQPDMSVESDLLSEVFTNGRLCFYQKDAGMYVYQYNNKLYWIANENFRFKEDGLTYVQYQLGTSRIDKLPEHRKQYGVDNIGFFFEEVEYSIENNIPYRVAITDIPNNYPITYILTGIYDTANNEWIWKRYFNLDYNFN